MQSTSLFFQRLKYVALVGLVLLWLIPIFYYTSLPVDVPIHFGSSGEPNNWTDKHYIFVLPIMGTFLYLFFTLILRRPAPTRISWFSSASNERQQQLGKEMSLIIITIAIFTFLYLTWAAIQTGLGNQNGIGSEFIPIFWFFTGSAIIYYTIPYVMAGQQKNN